MPSLVGAPLSPLEFAEAGRSPVYAVVDQSKVSGAASMKYDKRKVSGQGHRHWGTPGRASRFIYLVEMILRKRFSAALIMFAALLGVMMVMLAESARMSRSHPPIGYAIPTNEPWKAGSTASFKESVPSRNKQRRIQETSARASSSTEQPLKLLIESIHRSSDGFFFPAHGNFANATPDHGELVFDIFEEEGARRNIFKDFELYKTPDYEDHEAPFDDDVDAYYYDDDRLRGLATADLEKDSPKRCRKISEHELNFQNCNDFHQLDRLDPLTDIRFLSRGGYREVFSLAHHFGDESELLAMKDIRYDRDFDHETFEFVRMDAIVAERLSSSPRTYDIYGFCGFGIVSEYFYHGDIEDGVLGGEDGDIDAKDLDDKEKLKPQNNLTGAQKLVLSLEMAEAVADLHGFGGGLIIHDDIQLSQFLLNKNKTRLKLNDFNRAEFPLFDEESGEYCRYKNGKGGGNWRAPEEYRDDTLLEEIDVWSIVSPS